MPGLLQNNTKTSGQGVGELSPPTTRQVKSSSHMSDSRPDWLLYVVPSIAFVLGLFLFTLVCKTQQRKDKGVRRVSAIKNNTSQETRYTRSGFSGTSVINDSVQQKSSEPQQQNLRKQEAQSYENVTAVIYSNEEKVTYCLIQDEDYIIPDAVGETETEQHQNYLQTPLNLTDTDGESYENMEGSVYAQPRRDRLQHTISTDDDYVNPDDDQNLKLTDSESYENMDSVVCPVPAPVVEGWYECMDKVRMSKS